MAVNRNLGDSRLTLVLQTGVRPTGDPLVIRKTFARVQANATDADVHAVGIAFGGLQVYPVNAVERTDLATLVES